MTAMDKEIAWTGVTKKIVTVKHSAILGVTVLVLVLLGLK